MRDSKRGSVPLDRVRPDLKEELSPLMGTGMNRADLTRWIIAAVRRNLPAAPDEAVRRLAEELVDGIEAAGFRFQKAEGAHGTPPPTPTETAR